MKHKKIEKCLQNPKTAAVLLEALMKKLKVFSKERKMCKRTLETICNE